MISKLKLFDAGCQRVGAVYTCAERWLRNTGGILLNLGQRGVFMAFCLVYGERMQPILQRGYQSESLIAAVLLNGTWIALSEHLRKQLFPPHWSRSVAPPIGFSISPPAIVDHSSAPKQGLKKDKPCGHRAYPGLQLFILRVILPAVSPDPHRARKYLQN
jgi:hypothetical protein